MSVCECVLAFVWWCVHRDARVCACMSRAHVHGCARAVIHWGTHACARVYMWVPVCAVKEKQQEGFQILVLSTRASPLRPRGCSDPHPHCSGPVMSNGCLSKHKLGATPRKWPEEEVPLAEKGLE